MSLIGRSKRWIFLGIIFGVALFVFNNAHAGVTRGRKVKMQEKSSVDMWEAQTQQETHLQREAQQPSPTAAPPTAQPTSAPSSAPTMLPTSTPSASPTARPTSAPSTVMTSQPTSAPTAAPSASPEATVETAQEAQPPEKADNDKMECEGRCGPEYGQCSCISWTEPYCREGSGRCGGTTAHKQLSSGRYDYISPCNGRESAGGLLRLTHDQDAIEVSGDCHEVEAHWSDAPGAGTEVLKQPPNHDRTKPWQIEWHSEYLLARCNNRTLRAVKAIRDLDGPRHLWNFSALPPPLAKYDFNINIIRYESISRSDFFQYNPKTAGVVKSYADCDSKPGSSHCSFTFDRYAGAHGQTLQSLMAAFGGRKYDKNNAAMHAEFGGKFPEAGKTQFIWEYARRYGYKSAHAEPSNRMFGLDCGGKDGILSTFDNPGNTMHVPEYGLFDAHKGPGVYCIDGSSPAEFITDYARSFDRLEYNRSLSISEFLDAHSAITRKGDTDNWVGPYINETISKQPNSVFVVMSDHGQYYGNHYDGGNDEGRTQPLLSLILPVWFLEAHREVRRSLELNQHAFVNHYSLWHTLKHLVHFGSDLPPSELLSPTEATPPASRSLFVEASMNVTCDDLWLPLEWCPTAIWENIPFLKNNDSGPQMIVEILNGINKESRVYNESGGELTTCEQLTLKQVTEMKVHRPQPKEGPDGSQAAVTYIATFTAMEAPDMLWSASWERTSTSSTKIMFFKMIYSYQKYRLCRDNRINPHRCVCDLSKSSIDGPFKSQ